MTVFEMIILSTVLIIALAAACLCMQLDGIESERVIYRGKPEIELGRLAKGIGAYVLMIAFSIMVGILPGCASAPKPNLIPLQAEPVKAEKTTIQTWLDFFEPRD